jgi:lysophospholipase L1-like esterase
MPRILTLATAAILAAALAATATVTSNPRRAAAALRTYKIMPIGDSITRGQGDPAWNGYRADLDSRLATYGGIDAQMVGPWTDGGGDNNHAGTSGARIDQIHVQIPQLMSDYTPDIVLVQLGTNDLAQHYDEANAPERLRQLLVRIQQFRPGVRIYVATLTQFRDASWKPYVDAFNAGVQAKVPEFNSDKVTSVPNHIIGGEPNDLADQVHPSPCGYAKMAFVWQLYMDRSSLNPTPGSWLDGPWPWATNHPLCA